MDAHSTKFFRQLLDTPSPSGFEEAVQALWRKEVKTFCPDIRTDVHGSVIATLPGKSKKTSFLLLGHADEIGIIVHYIDDNGFLYFQTIGGWDTPTLLNQRVRLLGPKGIVHGVIGKIAVHLLNAEERDKAKIQLTDLWVDIGAKDKAQAQEYAPVGTPGVVGDDTMELLNGRFVARDFDNKMGCFVVSEVLRRLAKRKKDLFPTVIGASTVQEERGVWGARTVAYATKPTAAIAIDVSHATDIPGARKERHGDFKMGGGPILNTGVRTNKKLQRAIETSAKKHKIPVHLEVEAGSFGTDADPAAEAGAGIPVVSIGNALRYMHTAVEMADMNEIEQIVELITAFLLDVKADVDYTP